MKTIKGFSIAEALFTLFISLIGIYILTIGISNIKRLKVECSEYTDIVIAAKQLSQELMVASNIKVYTNSISYTKDLKVYTISLKKGTIVKQPGYEVICYNVDDLYFDCFDLITMTIERNEKEYEEIIGIYTLYEE